MDYRKFTAIHTGYVGVLDYANIFELLKDQEMVDKIRSEEIVDFHIGSMLAYYVNNVVSVSGSPKWVGSFACDVSYWISQKLFKYYSDIVGYVIDMLWYYDYVIDGDLCDEENESCHGQDGSNHPTR